VSDVLDRLARFATPTISNALEILGEDPAVGFTDGTIRPLSAEGLIFVGRALTATIVTAAPRRDGETHVPTEEYWRYVASGPAPKVVVVQDLDPEPVGSMWGEVQARVHRALGVTGVVTNGAVRDLNELEPGDLVHADRHGMQLISVSIDLEQLVRVATETEARERELFDAADRADGIEAFLSTWEDVRSRWPTAGGSTASPDALPEAIP
jgi:4-hydroxy-4-methyl-2-oxoglutarate aldolase